MLSETSGEFENRVFGDVQRNVFMPFFLVAYVNKAVVDAHFEFRG